MNKTFPKFELQTVSVSLLIVAVCLVTLHFSHFLWVDILCLAVIICFGLAAVCLISGVILYRLPDNDFRFQLEFLMAIILIFLSCVFVINFFHLFWLKFFTWPLLTFSGLFVIISLSEIVFYKIKNSDLQFELQWLFVSITVLFICLAVIHFSPYWWSKPFAYLGLFYSGLFSLYGIYKVVIYGLKRFFRL